MIYIGYVFRNRSFPRKSPNSVFLRKYFVCTFYLFGVCHVNSNIHSLKNIRDLSIIIPKTSTKVVIYFSSQIPLKNKVLFKIDTESSLL